MQCGRTTPIKIKPGLLGPGFSAQVALCSILASMTSVLLVLPWVIKRPAWVPLRHVLCTPLNVSCLHIVIDNMSYLLVCEKVYKFCKKILTRLACRMLRVVAARQPID